MLWQRCICAAAVVMAQRRAAGGCCCSRAPINEDNARFCLLAGLILLYLLCGAAIFSALEHPFELRARRLWKQQLDNFTQRYGVNLAALHTLLRQYEEANGAGIRVDALRPRWDFSGAFYFVGTVVSTIGFGMTTPATIGGKTFLIFYGLIGCAATILFFNLFLERIITMLAYIMRWCHERRLRCGGVGVVANTEESPGEEEDSLEGWKPSVYYVMLILGLASVVIACSASTLYSSMENWSYVDSLYFCFVAFSTIGFGDLVSSQREHYESQGAYRLGNCLFILMGACCIYSLFNVISIIIKQILNWILSKLVCHHNCSCSPASCWWLCCPCIHKKHHNRSHPPAHLSRKRLKRNTVQPISTQCPAGKHRYRDGSVETICDSETDAGGVADGVNIGRHLSGEMISVNEFMVSNKVSLALLQKQLSETAHQGPRQSYGHQNGFSGGVGALGIMNNRLQETSVDR
ncbi:potassium channel subfamily K member 13 [Thalassophryne amazonica]|uniref:potassium channel subfamily K member 13 n=1 Tax=Thalassophryne amazonica TaxID=390379 RepID=UPI001471A383|nr:potassium channel subfamily K member 13 [Thalassophryne amazonica]